MNVKRFVCCLLASVLLLGVSLISCGNSSRAKAKNEIAQSGEDFKSFLDKFTSSAAFQYTRIKFPLKTPITLLEKLRKRFRSPKKNGRCWIVKR